MIGLLHKIEWEELESSDKTDKQSFSTTASQMLHTSKEGLFKKRGGKKHDRRQYVDCESLVLG